MVAAIIIVVFVLLGYWSMLSGFFQQDEWLAFAYNHVLSEGGIISILKEAFGPSVGHYQPFNILAINVLTKSFGLNYPSYAIVSLLLHLTCVLLLFYLAKIIFRDQIMAFFVALLFGISAVNYQATSWVLADTSIHFSTILALLSLIMAFLFINTQHEKYYYLSLAALVLSLFFKEITLPLFLILPLTLAIFKSKLLMKKKRLILLTFLLCFCYLLIRWLMIFLPQSYTNDVLVTDVVVTSQQPLVFIIYNFVTFPIQAIAQSIVPVKLLLDWSYSIGQVLPDSLAGGMGSLELGLFAEHKIFNFLTFGISACLVVLSIITWFKSRKTDLSKLIIWSLIFVALNSPIFALSPERVGKVYILDSRNLYLISIGSSFLIVALLQRILSVRRRLFYLVISLIIGVNMLMLSSSINDLAMVGKIRLGILNQISSDNKQLSPKVIFYTESDKSFYGLPPDVRILPFQSGLGQTLLVWYYPKEEFPLEFFQNRYLWAIDSQGYQESNGRGFGYFYNFGDLKNYLIKHRLPDDLVVAYSFRARDSRLTNITTQVRDRLSAINTPQIEIPARQFNLTVDNNNQEIHFGVDGLRQTAWRSSPPYAKLSTVVVGFNEPRKICQISLDSFEDKNQDKVGFKVSSSVDENLWETVFESEIFPPNIEGLVELPLKPVRARLIKISQIGYHPFASWQINELKVYQCQE